MRSGACGSVSTSRRARPRRRDPRALRARRGGGLSTAWAGQTFDHDALTLLALAARATRRIELGSWVVPAPLRHPAVLAQQALTVQAASGGRLVLGVGVSHEEVVARFGVAVERPARHMREYLELLCRCSLASAPSTQASATASRSSSAGAEPPPVLLAALGPAMLRLAGAAADGAAIWLGSPRFPRDVRDPAPARGRARRRPSRAAHRLRLPVAVTRDARGAREGAEALLARSSEASRLSARARARRPGAALRRGDRRRRMPWRASSRPRPLGVTDFTAVLFDVPATPKRPRARRRCSPSWRAREAASERPSSSRPEGAPPDTTATASPSATRRAGSRRTGTVRRADHRSTAWPPRGAPPGNPNCGRGGRWRAPRNPDVGRTVHDDGAFRARSL